MCNYLCVCDLQVRVPSCKHSCYRCQKRHIFSQWLYKFVSEKFWLPDPFRALNYVCFLNPVMHLSSLENIEFSLQWQPSDLCTDVGIEHSAALLGLQQSPKRAQEDCASWALASLHWAERALKRTCLLAWTGEANPSVEISLALPAEPLFQIQGWNFEYDESGLFSSRYLFSQMGSDKYITRLYKNVWKV